MKLSFSTLGCLKWDWDKTLDEAVRMGYDGIEVRGVGDEMYLPAAAPFLPENLAATMEGLRARGLQVICLDTSCIFDAADKYDENVQAGKAYIDLAQKMGVPYIRMFGDRIADPAQEDAVVGRVVSGLRALGEYAEGKGVLVLIESHGDFARSDRLVSVMEAVASPAVGVLWDFANTYKRFGEPLADTYSRIGKWVHHVHVKDSIGSGAEAKHCMIGQGDLPIGEAVRVLRQHGYDGWLSLEWEKKWHPELDEPEVAFPIYMDLMRGLLEG